MKNRWRAWLVGLGLSVSVAEAQPIHDECVDAISVETGVPFMGSTVGAGGVDVSSCGSGDVADVWHVWTADCTGKATVSLCGSGFDTVLAVYDACDGSQLACRDDSPDVCVEELASHIFDLPVDEGRRYWVRVSGDDGATGDYTLTVSCQAPEGHACCLSDQECQELTEPNCQVREGRFFPDQICRQIDCSLDPPDNDQCLGATPVFTDAPFRGSTAEATGGRITSCGEDSKDVWHVWRSDCAGRVAFSLCGSGFDTILSLYPDCTGQLRACNDDNLSCVQEHTSLITLRGVRAGRDYYLRVAGWSLEYGDYVLTVSCERPLSRRNNSMETDSIRNGDIDRGRIIRLGLNPRRHERKPRLRADALAPRDRPIP